MADFRPAIEGMPNWVPNGELTSSGERIPKLLLNVGELAEVKLWGKSYDHSDLAFSDLSVARIQATIEDPTDRLIMILRVLGKQAGIETLAALDSVERTEQAHLIIQVVDPSPKPQPSPRPAAAAAENDTIGDGDAVIERSPDFATVAVGAKIRYTLKAKDSMPPASQRSPSWYVLYEARTSPNWFKRLIDGETSDQRHPGSGMSCVWVWDRPGVHTVFCRLGGGSGRQYYSRTQVVRPLHDLARKAFAAPRPVREDPVHAALAARGNAAYLRKILEAYPDAGSPAQRDDVEVHCDRLETWAEDVDEIVAEISDGEIFLVKAVLMIAENNQSVDLRVFMAKLDGGRAWRLVDYTEPAQNHRSSSYYEVSADDDALDPLSAAEAVEQLIVEWQGNRYYSGEVIYQFPAIQSEGFGGRSGSFETTGSNPLEQLADFLSTASVATLAAAAVSAALLPVPVAGAVVAELMLWSLVTSVASGALMTYNRVTVGEQRASDTVFDVVRVATLLIPLGTYWAEGVRVSNVSSFVKNTNLSEAVFFGSTAAGTLNGMLVGADIARGLTDILADDSLDPNERAERVQRLLMSAVASGLILVIPSILAERQLKYNDPNRTLNELLTELGDSKKNVPLKRPPGKTPAADGKHEQTVTTQKQPPPAATGGSTPKQPPPANERGLRASDDATFARLAKRDQRYILVRDSNKAAAARIGAPGYAPKPMKVKAKTLKADDIPPPKPENVGLVAANPLNPRFQEILDAGKKATGDPNYDYAKYKAEMEATGFGIDEANDYLVFQRSPSKAYLYSDADLHGVYTKDGKLVPVTKEVLADFEQAFGLKLVQHGAQDEWVDRKSEKAGPNRGPQVPTTVYLPDGTKQHLTSIPEMREFYIAHGLPWATTWGPEF